MLATAIPSITSIALIAGCHGVRTIAPQVKRSCEVPVQWLTAHDAKITVLEVIDETAGRSCQVDLNGTLLKFDHLSLNLDSVDRVDAFVWDGNHVLLFRGNTCRAGSGISYDQAAAAVLDHENDYEILHIPLHYTEFDMQYEFSLDARYWPVEVGPDGAAAIRYEVEAWSSFAPDTTLQMTANVPTTDAVTADEMLKTWQAAWSDCRDGVQRLRAEYKP